MMYEGEQERSRSGERNGWLARAEKNDDVVGLGILAVIVAAMVFAVVLMPMGTVLKVGNAMEG
jgi:hypothetical protein